MPTKRTRNRIPTGEYQARLTRLVWSQKKNLLAWNFTISKGEHQGMAVTKFSNLTPKGWRILRTESEKAGYRISTEDDIRHAQDELTNERFAIFISTEKKHIDILINRQLKSDIEKFAPKEN